MNKIRAVQALTKKEIEQGIASWHTEFRDTAFIYFGGLPYEFSEGDVITIFSQYGEPVFLKLVRDKDTGKSKGFGWLKYEDQRSTDLAVDNLGGAEIGGRLISVDHARYKARDDEDQDEFRVSWADMRRREGHAVSEDESSEEDQVERRGPLLPEEQELVKLIRDHDNDDPMKTFLIEEKRKLVDEAKSKAERRESRAKHRHHRTRSSRHDGPDEHRSGKPRERDASRDRRRQRRDQGSRERRSDSRERRRGSRERRREASRTRRRNTNVDDDDAHDRYGHGEARHGRGERHKPRREPSPGRPHASEHREGHHRRREASTSRSPRPRRGYRDYTEER